MRSFLLPSVVERKPWGPVVPGEGERMEYEKKSWEERCAKTVVVVRGSGTNGARRCYRS